VSGLADQIVDDLKRRILDGGIAPGAKLPGENSLVEEFGVSRTVVREAVSRLQAAGLVEVWKGRKGKRPQTLVRITDHGRERFREYLNVLESVIDSGESGAGAGNDPSSAIGAAAAQQQFNAMTLNIAEGFERLEHKQQANGMNISKLLGSLNTGNI